MRFSVKNSQSAIFIPAVILVLVFAVFPVASPASSEGGSAIFNSRGCTECHLVKRPEGTSIVTTIDEVIKKKGPDLWYAGLKFQKGFLDSWLQDPKPIRPMEFYSLKVENKGTHPRLGKIEAKSVAGYLLTMGVGASLSGGGPVPKTPSIKPDKSVRSRIVFEKKQGCYGCHRMVKGRNLVGGLSGPSLIGAGKRLRPEWVYAFLKDPARFVPVGSMPVYKGLLTDKEMRSLAAYVATFK